MGKRKFGTCCLYGKEAVLTKDHAIPRALFLAPRPTNLITVPACGSCNNDLKLDEQYFRACVLTGRAYDHPVGRTLWDTEVRSDLATGPGFKALLASQTRTIKLQTENGVFFQDLGVLEIDRNRIERVIRKIVKGLYYHHRGQVLGEPPFTIAVETLDPNKALRETAEIWKQCLGQSLGNGSVTYRYGIANDEPTASIWWLLFYSGLLITAVTGVDEQLYEAWSREQESTISSNLAVT